MRSQDDHELETMLEDGMHRLADRIDLPGTVPGEDLARGRARRRRRRVSVGAGVAAVAVVGAGAFAVPRALDGQEAGYAGGGDTPAPGPEITPSARKGERVIPDGDRPSSSKSGQVDADADVHLANRRAVARHLDPDGEHITDQAINELNQTGTRTGDEWASFTEKIGWRNPGEEGLGVVSLTVATSFEYDCGGHGAGGPSTTCTDVTLDGTSAVRVADSTEPGVVTYAYRRDDGYMVALSLSEAWGNNAGTPVDGIDVSDAQIAAVLTDPVVDLPGHPAADQQELLAGSTLRDVTRDVLDPESAHLTDESWAGDRGGYYSADWTVDGTKRAEVQIQQGIGNYPVDAPCDDAFATRCVRKTVDGVDVRIDYRRKVSGSGYDVTIDGDRRPIWVHVDPVDPASGYVIAPDLAVELALDSALQQ